MILRSVELWPQSRWLLWGEAQGFSPSTQRGRTERDPQRNAQHLSHIASGADASARAQEFANEFALMHVDARRWQESATHAVQEGQGAFCLRLLDAYGNQCAVMGEHTTPVLDAVRTQASFNPASNHVQNGLVLTKEFHTLFDRGYVKVSPQLRSEFHNGRRYYPRDGQPLAKLPRDARARPSADALACHVANVFRAG